MSADPLPTGENVEAVPFLDLRPSNEVVAEAVLEDIGKLIQTGQFTNGRPVEEFERDFAEYVGVRHCVGISSGLDALRIGLLAAGIERGDEVLVPAATFAATFEAVLQAGGRPIVVDVGEDDYALDPALAEQALTERTRFLLPVHLYGQMADMRALEDLAESRRVGILEDACQAHGAVRDTLRAGAAGRMAAFSFYPSKNLGAMGDAGALVTDDAGVAARARALREHGQTRKYEYDLQGYTARLDAVQAAVLVHKLRLLDRWNAQRRAAAQYYLEALDGLGDLALPAVPAGSEPVWHVFVVKTADPEALASFLAERGVATGRHYPRLPHLSPAYTDLGLSEGEFPVAEELARKALSLPIYPGISETQLARVCDATASYFRRG